MDKEQRELHDMMKNMMADKTDCMIASYGAVLSKTRGMMFAALDGQLEDKEIAQRADMFWNIALQRIDKELSQARKIEDGTPQAYREGETPCQKRAREDAQRIAALEAKIKA
jgi:hypothetical protein